MPKFCLLYLKNLLDIAIVRFFDLYNDSFVKSNGKYVLSKSMSKTEFKRILKKLVFEELSKHVSRYDRLSPLYYVIIGSCFPKDNLLLDFKDNVYFPEKLSKLVENENNIKYLLKEKDIDIDILKFNSICADLSNELLKKDAFTKHLGKEYKNVFFVQHRKLDCYVMFKVLKFIYGKGNCINMHKEKLSTEKLPLVAINDIIGKYINKSEMNKSQKLKVISEEIKQYIDERIRSL